MQLLKCIRNELLSDKLLPWEYAENQLLLIVHKFVMLRLKNTLINWKVKMMRSINCNPQNVMYSGMY